MSRCVCSALVVFVLSGIQVLGAADSLGYLDAFKDEPAPTVGGQYYLRHCLMHEKGEHMATNYWRGTLVPINTKVTLVSLDPKRFTLKVDGTGETFKVENVPNFTRADTTAIARRMLSRTPMPIEKFGDAMARQIKNGVLKLGMTKEQVLMARGYPPGHQTSSLELDNWKYWSSRLVVHTIVFTNGVLTAGRGLE